MDAVSLKFIEDKMAVITDIFSTELLNISGAASRVQQAVHVSVISVSDNHKSADIHTQTPKSRTGYSPPRSSNN